VTPSLPEELVDKLVLANHILFKHGVVDGLGHVSVRHPERPELFLLSCNRAPALVRREDIVCYDYDGNAVTPDAPRPYLERFIHGEIFRARNDVMAVVHSHSPNVVPFGATKSPLRPIYHMAGFLGGGSAHFEMRDVAGDSDLLVRNSELGRALAQSLARCNCVLMRGHGSTVVGTSIEQVVFRAIYAELNARLQAQAMGIGEVTYLTPGEADLASATNDSQLQRSWDLWARSVRGEI
jgi:HCOMODA/2-hydroxy-3-carboxy-muconic semialdehyde decarboxylase